MADTVFLSALLFSGSWENGVVSCKHFSIMQCFSNYLRSAPIIVVHTISLKVSSPANIGLFSPVRSPIALVNLLTISKLFAPLASELQDVK
jgi:hypothetical protein